MSYLVLTRTPGERIRITACPEVEDAELLRQLRSEGIDVIVSSVAGRQVKLGFKAPICLQILREELSSEC